ncbi:hypothetical protein Tco_0890146 [Tanacetum coccineum]
MDSRPSTSSDVSSGFAAEREKAIGCLEKEKPTFCLNSKDGLSPMRAGTPDGGVQAQFAERGCCLRAFTYVPFQEERNTCAKACLNSRVPHLFGLELEMLEGTLKTIEDTMARMDKEAYEVYNEAKLMGFYKGIIEGVWVVLQKGAATGKLKSRLQGEEDLQGKRGNTPKEHSKRRMDVVGWNFVMYNRSEQVNVEKAMDSFLKGAARGSTLAMVDAGLVYWEFGKKDEGVRMYKRGTW